MFDYYTYINRPRPNSEREYYDMKMQEAIQRDVDSTTTMLELKSIGCCPHTLGRIPVSECPYWPCKEEVKEND